MIETKCIDWLRRLLRFQTGAAERSLESFRYGSALMYDFDRSEPGATWSTQIQVRHRRLWSTGPGCAENNASNTFNLKSL